MSPELPLLTIAIPTYNRARLLDELLTGLRGHSELPEALSGEFEVLVVDNASTDGTPAVCARHLPSLTQGRIIRQPANVGFPGNVRTAFEAARGCHVWILCDDDLADIAIIPRILRALRNYPRAAAFLLNRDIYDVSMTRLLHGNRLGFLETVVHDTWVGKLRHAGDLLTASCTVLRREEARRGFDHPTFVGTYCETMVLSLHALQCGDLVVLGDAAIRYREGNNGSWNALWPWIHFYNMPAVVHTIADRPGEWIQAHAFVAGRKNDLIYNSCYLSSSPIPKIQTGYRREELRFFYRNCAGAALADFVAFGLPRFVPRMIVFTILGFRGLRRLLSEVGSIRELFALPGRIWLKFRGFRAKEKS